MPVGENRRLGALAAVSNAAEHRAGPRRRVLITDRDRRLLGFAAQHRFVLAGQIATLVGSSRSAATARLLALASAGYLHRERRLHGEPPCFQITSQGLRAAGSGLTPPRELDLSNYRHDAGIGWLMVAAERGRFGPLREIISEREMRSRDAIASRSPAMTGARERLGVRIGGVGPGGGERLHYPDLVLVTATGHRIAFELELTPKPRTRREQILAAYAGERRIDAVMYLVDLPATGHAIARSARRLGIADRVRVHGVRLDAGRAWTAARGVTPIRGAERAA
jgi:hypothetical protein